MRNFIHTYFVIFLYDFNSQNPQQNKHDRISSGRCNSYKNKINLKKNKKKRKMLKSENNL